MIRWKIIRRTEMDSHYYCVLGLANPDDGMVALREMFPDGEADPLNFVMFSTSGVHGTYNTIEQAEAALLARDAGTEERDTEVTFVVFHPRVVCMRYGNCRVENLEDIALLKKLRASSARVFAEACT